MVVEKLTPVPLRDLWLHEAYDFTTWLSKNLDLLSDTLSLELSLVQREANVGSFSVDILAQTPNGNSVVIENQLEPTDHDHLGKLITYLSNLDARAAVWVTSEPRPEHRRAVDWLNEMLPADKSIFLVRIEAYATGESSYAARMMIAAGPSHKQSRTHHGQKETGGRQAELHEFWRQLLKRSNEKTSLYSGVSSSKDSWLNKGAGRSGIVYQYRVRQHEAVVQLRIRGDTAAESQRMFNALHARKEAIEREFGNNLSWEPREGARACYIVGDVPGGGWADRDDWLEIHEAMTDAMVRFDRAFRREIRGLS
jgi:hypothetical protein